MVCRGALGFLEEVPLQRDRDGVSQVPLRRKSPQQGCTCCRNTPQDRRNLSIRCRSLRPPLSLHSRPNTMSQSLIRVTDSPKHHLLQLNTHNVLARYSLRSPKDTTPKGVLQALVRSESMEIAFLERGKVKHRGPPRPRDNSAPSIKMTSFASGSTPPLSIL